VGCELARSLIFPLLPPMISHRRFSHSQIDDYPQILLSWHPFPNLTLTMLSPSLHATLRCNPGLNLLELCNFDTFNQNHIDHPRPLSRSMIEIHFGTLRFRSSTLHSHFSLKCLSSELVYLLPHIPSSHTTMIYFVTSGF
jgi:hypothetical protein